MRLSGREIIEWYSSLSGEAKAEVDAYLVQTGKISVLTYGTYSTYTPDVREGVHIVSMVPYLRDGIDGPYFYDVGHTAGDDTVCIWAIEMLMPLYYAEFIY